MCIYIAVVYNSIGVNVCAVVWYVNNSLTSAFLDQTVRQMTQSANKRPTMLELATTENKRKLTEKIQQRLLQRSDTPSSSVVRPHKLYLLYYLLAMTAWDSVI